MGTAKGLLSYGQRSWLEEHLHAFAGCGGRRAVVVLGFRQQEYLTALPWMQEGIETSTSKYGLDITVVINRHPELGPFSSIHAGADWLMVNIKSAGIFITPVDTPCPGSEVWQKLSAALRGDLAVCLPHCQGRGGHPVLLSSAFIRQLLIEPLDSPSARLDVQIKQLPVEQVRRVAVDDERIGMNINTPEKWRQFCNKIR